MTSIRRHFSFADIYWGNRGIPDSKSIGFRWPERKVPATFCVSCYSLAYLRCVVLKFAGNLQQAILLVFLISLPIINEQLLKYKNTFFRRVQFSCTFSFEKNMFLFYGLGNRMSHI